MKYLLFLLIFFTFNINSENNNQYIVDYTFLDDAGSEDIMNFKNNFTYRNTKSTASWKDNMGDYGIIKCLGNYLSHEKSGTNLNFYCQGSNKDGETFWLTMKRNSADFEGGIGKIEYVFGESKFKKLINKKCVYAVKISTGFSILKQKCKMNN